MDRDKTPSDAASPREGASEEMRVPPHRKVGQARSQERKAEALRANLQRRKAAARGEEKE